MASKPHLLTASKFKDLVVTYKDISHHLQNLEEFVKLSYESEENHTSVMKSVHSYISDMKKELDKMMKEGHLGDMEKMLEKIVRWY